MLTAYSRSQFVEKVITDAQGRQFKAVFFVTLEGDEVHARIVSIKAIAPVVLALKGTVAGGSLCLTGSCSSHSLETPYIFHAAPVVSPYFNLDLFLSTQPTRAPAYR